MSEPGPLTAAGGIALYKLGAFGFIAVLAAVVVMAMTLPKTVREFCVAMISTTVSSICGGAFVVRWLGIAGSAAAGDRGDYLVELTPSEVLAGGCSRYA
jgi:vacuolar-type H+-ATPase subunit I/STV1